MIQRKDISGIELPQNVGWYNPGQLSPENQMEVLRLTLKEPLGSYKSDFFCLGNWRSICSKEAITRNCILRGLCHFCQRYFPNFGYPGQLGNDDGLLSYRNEVWRRNVDEVWSYFMRSFVLWKWAVMFYDRDEEAIKQAEALSEKEEVEALFNLESLVDRLTQGQIKINLGKKMSWQKEEKPLYLTIEKDFVFGVETEDEGGKTDTERQIYDHSLVGFLMSLKVFLLKVGENQLTKHSLEWFFLMDSDDQSEWIYNVLSEIRRKPVKLLWYERRHELGPALRYLRSNLTTEAAYLTTLCFHASKGFLEGPAQEEFSFNVLDRVFELEKLAREGRTFWEGWKEILSRHIGDVFSGLIYYAPKDKKLPLSPESWFDILAPQKEAFWNFLFFLKEDEKEKVLELINWELEFLKKYKYLVDGMVQKRPELPSCNYAGLKSGLKNLANSVFN